MPPRTCAATREAGVTGAPADVGRRDVPCHGGDCRARRWGTSGGGSECRQPGDAGTGRFGGPTGPLEGSRGLRLSRPVGNLRGIAISFLDRTDRRGMTAGLRYDTVRWPVRDRTLPPPALPAGNVSHYGGTFPNRLVSGWTAHRRSHHYLSTHQRCHLKTPGQTIHQIVAAGPLDIRKTMVVGIALLLGLSHETFPTFDQTLPHPLQVVTNFMLSIATISAVSLNLLCRFGIRKTSTTTIETEPGQPRPF